MKPKDKSIEYARKPYFRTESSYPDMMTSNWEFQSHVKKHSEMLKPYLSDGDFQDMEGFPRFPWPPFPPPVPPMPPMPDDPTIDTETHVPRMMCSADGCICPGETDCVTFSCTSGYPLYLLAVTGSIKSYRTSGMRIDSNKGEICVTAPTGGGWVFVTVKAKTSAPYIVTRNGVPSRGSKSYLLKANMSIPICDAREDRKCATCTPTCLTECCTGMSIGYSSAQMNVGESQNITINGTPLPGCSLSLTSEGGGTLTGSGTTYTYTAPSTNPDCNANGLLKLRKACVPLDSWKSEWGVNAGCTIPGVDADTYWQCTAKGITGNSEPTWTGDTVVDGTVTWTKKSLVCSTLKIAVNASDNQYIVYVYSTTCENYTTHWICPGQEGTVPGNIPIYKYHCDGSYVKDSGLGCIKDWYKSCNCPDCWTEAVSSGQMNQTDNSGALCQQGVPCDLRTPAQKLAGCCPAVLL